MRSLSVIVGVLAVLGAASCRRPLNMEDGGDTGVLPQGDGGFVDLAAPDSIHPPPFDALLDLSGADVAVDAPRPDTAGDAEPDLIPGATCPAAVTPVDVCGCGCCGEAMGRACYYPTLGQSRESVPNPMPPPSTCAAAGCSFGVRHLCCADPGPQPGAVTYCAYDTSDEDFPRFQITRRDGATCTTLEMSPGVSGSPVQIMTSASGNFARAWRGPCDGSAAKKDAIGGLGSVTWSPLAHIDGNGRRDIHAALFFDSGTGIADVVRIDADDVVLGPHCQPSSCPVCGGTCAFDQRYDYGLVGGRAAWRHYAILDPPTSFTHVRTPTTTMPPDQSCAPPLPVCGSAAIDAGDAMAALADRDVQLAFGLSQAAGGSPLQFGIDPRVVDGQIFEITRSGGGTIWVGAQCPPGAPASACTPIPGGLTRLVSVLLTLDEQQLADPACAGLPR